MGRVVDSISNIRLVGRALKSIVTQDGVPFFATVLLTERCNLTCRHCGIRDPKAEQPPFDVVVREMEALHALGVSIIIFSGGEPLLWRDGDKSFRHVAEEARRIGFLGVCLATNGTMEFDFESVDFVFLSIDGRQAAHDDIRGTSFDRIMKNLNRVTRRNVCVYMALNKRNWREIRPVAKIARQHPAITGVSFNFHTPYPGTESLTLDREETTATVAELERLSDDGYRILNLKTTLRAWLADDWPRPLHACRITDFERHWDCARCALVPGLCERCGFLFAVEFGLIFSGRWDAIFEAARAYPKFM